MKVIDRLNPVLKRNGVFGVFLLLSLVFYACGTQRELNFSGNGYQVYPHIAAPWKHGESSELKLWFRTKQPSGMLLMMQNFRGSLTLVGIYQGKLR